MKKIKAMSDLRKIVYYAGKMEKEGGLFKGFPTGMFLRSAYEAYRGATEPFFVQAKKPQFLGHTP